MKKFSILLLSGITLIGCHESKKDKVIQIPAAVNRIIMPKIKITIPKIPIMADADYASPAISFVNGYIYNRDELRSLDEIGEWVAASPYVTDKFKMAIKSEIVDINNEPETNLDADIIFDTQDYPDEGLELESFDQKTGHVVLRGERWKDFKLNIKLVEKNGKWLVDDCGDFEF